MRKILTKICGVTRVEDALAAVECGADLIGLIFVAKSPRNVSDDAARAIVEAVGGRAKVVGVFQNENEEAIAEKRRALKLDLVQLHGNEPRSMAEALRPCIKVVTYGGDDENVHKLANQYSGACDYLLFDLPKNAEAGRLRNSSACSRSEPQCVQTLRPLQITSEISTPFLMAGGIDAHNVGPIAAALIGNRSFVGIDVASGVESAPGVKDHEKIRSLMEKVQEVSLNAIAR